MDTHPTLRLSFIFLFTLLSPLANAYPEGYPNLGDPRIIETTGGAQEIRIAANNNEYLVAWLTQTGISAVRLTRDDLTPIRDAQDQPIPPFEMVRVAGTDETLNPLNGDFLTRITDFDLAFHRANAVDSTQPGRYFLAVKVQSMSSAPLEDPCDEPGEPSATNPCDTPYKYTQLLGHYLDANRTANIANWEQLARDDQSLGNLDNVEGIRAVATVNQGDSNTSINLFWLERGHAGDILGGRSGSVLGRVVSGRDFTSGELQFGTAPRTLMSVEDQDPNDENDSPGSQPGRHSFALNTLDVGYDPDQNIFLLTSAIGETSFSGGDYDFPLVYSYIAAIVINQHGLTLVQGADANDYSPISTTPPDQNIAHRDSLNSANFPYRWVKYSPKVILGKKDGTARRWMIAFTGKYDIDNDAAGLCEPDSPPGASCSDYSPFQQGHFARRLSVLSGGAIANVDTSDIFLGGRNDFADYQYPVITGNGGSGPSSGLWLDDEQRFLVSWSYAGIYADTSSDSGGTAATSAAPLQITGAGLGRPSVLVQTTAGRLFGISGPNSPQLQIQPMLLNWQDIELQATRTDGNSSVPLSESAAVQLNISRAQLDDDVTDAAGDFDSGAYILHITTPDGITIDENEHTVQLGAGFFKISGPAFIDGDVHTYDLVFRNANALNIDQDVAINFALEGSQHRFDIGSENDAAVIALSLQANPNGIDPPDDGGDDGGGEDGGGEDGGGGDDNGDNTPPPSGGGDDNDDDNDGDDIGTPPPDDSDDEGTSGSGGGALGWLLLGLACFAVRRRRIS